MAQPERNSDFVDRLACKYMRKCKVKVESSTDSDSDNEVFGAGPTSTQNHSLPWKKRSSKLQFIDPYDADSEEASTQSDSNMHNWHHRERDRKLQLGEMDRNTQQGTPSVPDYKPTPDDFTKTGVCETGDVSMKALTDSETPFPTTGSQDMNMDTGATSEARSSICHFLLTGLDKRTSSNPRGNAQSMIPHSTTSQETSDFCTLPISAEKRKLGLKSDLNDKIRRKKARVTEPVQLPMLSFQSS